MDTLYIVMPAYNEEDSIANVVRDWHAIVEKIGGESKLMVINDGSRDRTLEVLHELCAELPRLDTVDKKNSGHGATCLFGYREAISRGADYVFQTDSDGQTSPTDFWKVWALRATADFVLGYRSARQDGFSRLVVTRVLRVLIFAMFGTYIRDANTPFRLMAASRLSVYLPLIPKDFFLANTLLSIVAVKKHERVAWARIEFKQRLGGETSVPIKKMFSIGVRAVKDFGSVRKTLGI